MLDTWLSICAHASIMKILDDLKLVGQTAWFLGLALENRLGRTGTRGVQWNTDGEVKVEPLSLANRLFAAAKYEGVAGRRRMVLHYYHAVERFFPPEVLMNCAFASTGT